MRIKHRFVFNNQSNNFDISKLLNQQGVKFEYSEPFTIFELFEDQTCFEEIIQLLAPYNVSRNLPEAIYTREEINTAQWLTVRSNWRSLYPYPRENMGYRFTTYDATDFCEREGAYFCGKGLVQRDSFVLEKAPNWGPRNFLMINWVEDELFISQRAEEVLQSSHLMGFEMYDVMDKRKSKMSGIKQMFVKEYLREGLCAEAIQETLICPKCNLTKYILKAGSTCFKKEVFRDVKNDVVKTKEKFGGIGCISLILITHDFYKVLTKAKLDKGLVFEPVALL